MIGDVMKIPTYKEELKKTINSLSNIILWISVLLIYLGIWIDGYHLKLIATALLTFMIGILISYIAYKVVK